MIAAGIVVDNILRSCVRAEDPKFVALVWQMVNVEYFDICSNHSILKLRGIAEIDYSSQTATGLYLPGDMMGIDDIRDQDYDQRFWERSRGDIDPDENGYRAVRYCPETEDGYFGKDLTINQGATTFVAPGLTTDFTDSYVQFGIEPGFYLLTATKTFEPTYWGPRLSGEDVRVRPKEAEKLILYDDTQELYDAGTVDVYYWKAPQPLYRKSDVIVLPDHNWLELRVLRKLPEAKERMPVSQSQINGAEKTMLAKNPSFSINKPRRDRQKQVFGFSSKTYYKARG